MTTSYNKYLRTKPDSHYTSEIAFVSSQNNIITKELYYVDFKKDSLFKSGYYLDNNKELKNIYYNYLKFKKMSRSDINQISRSVKHYTYVKIIEDRNNPQLEGQIMIFSFGRKISDMIVVNKNFNKTFRLNIDIIMDRFQNYDKSHFTETNINLVDNNLNLDSELNYRTINFKAFERKEKLKNIKSEIELKDLRYKEYLKLKKEFEN